MKNLEYLQMCILCEHKYRIEAVNRGLIIDIADHVTGNSRFTYILNDNLSEEFRFMLYDCYTDTWNSCLFSLGNEPGMVFFLCNERKGNLLFVSPFSASMILINPLDVLSAQVFNIQPINKEIVPVQYGEVAILFSPKDKSVCILDISTRTFGDWKYVSTFPDYFFTWYFWKREYAIATKTHVLLFVPKLGQSNATTVSYCPSTEVFSKVAPPPETLSSGFACCLLDDANVLLSGGYNDSLDDVSSACFTYNIEKDTWSTFTQMNIPRRGHAITKNGKGDIMVFGGYTLHGTFNDSYEVYDESIGKWTVFRKDFGESHITAITI